MKRIYLLATALAALVSCTSDDFMGDSPGTQTVEETTGEGISFGFDFQNVTRAGDLVGKDAATKLQNQFIVYGTKHESAEVGAATNDEVVFKNYVVEYDENTAGKTTSNTHNWEYVGKTPYAADKVSPAITTAQGIKYWDYSAANGYTFYGIAAKADIATNNKITIVKTTTGSTVYDKGYSVTLLSGAELDNLYVADRKPVAKSDYQKPVTLTFRNFGARVRVGFYETVPGYKVKIDKFYYDADAEEAVTGFAPMVDDNTTNFAASLQNLNKAESQTIAISYYDNTDASIENHVKLTPSTAKYKYTLTLGTGVVSAEELAITSATPTWDQTAGAYTTVFPFEGNTNPMLIKMDYTLTAEDGSETIKVKGANAIVPTQYVQWKSNFAYTYIFKISSNTNGYTGETTDPAGLFPITFDAVVVDVADDKTQETITTFADYSITTYANGSKVTENGEYKVGEDIYVVKVNNATNEVLTHTFIGEAGNCVNVYKVTSAGGEPINEATVLARKTGSPNGLTLEAVSGADFVTYVPAADGTYYNFGYKGAVKFTPGTTGSYAYISTRQAYVGPTYEAVGDAAYSSTTTYYFKTTANVYYAASGINAGNFASYKDNLYTKTAAGTPGLYDIKVINVVE